MNGDGPCQAQRQLTERALHLSLDLARLFVQCVVCVLPLHGFHADGLVVALTKHGDGLVADGRDAAYTPVIEAVVDRGVVLDEHDLCTLLQHQRLGRGIGVVRKRALHLGPEQELPAGQLLQFGLVVEIGQVVVGGQADGVGQLRVDR